MAFLVQIKDELGNFNNDIGFFSTLMAKEHLVRTVDVVPFDSYAPLMPWMGGSFATTRSILSFALMPQRT